MIKISFIVPVYNVEHYLEKCVQSLLEQNIPDTDYEIILVDDGSTDQSGELVDRLSETYPVIKKIHQENKGLSEARNTGLKAASGQYIWFIDSDDFILPDCLAELTDLCDGQNLEIVDMRFDRIDESGHKIQGKQYRPQFPFGKVVDGGEYLNHYTFESGVWHYFFLREFLTGNNLLFVPGIYHEDEEFTPRALFHAQRITVIEKVFYFYLQRSNSIITTANRTVMRKKIRDLLLVISHLNALKQTKKNDAAAKGLAKRINMLTKGILLRLKGEKHSVSLFFEILSGLFRIRILNKKTG